MSTNPEIWCQPPIEERVEKPKTAARSLQPGRFLSGLALTAAGVTAILLIAIDMLHLRQPDRHLPVPVLVAGAVAGTVLLAAGFGLMATASAVDDEQEFDRLLRGESSRCSADEHRHPPTA